jgi:diaminohydroxyphosphoribosylaminopyrimidine deaminase/5-amino-6-(5-phosphoribosylamino)uracil reductase
MESQDSRYMQMALGLAKRGIGSVEPNPAVGCVIVKSDQIIGRGWHKQYGGPHAEINAIEDCKAIGASPKGATLYVTLEPCCHQGKTGPCTDAIVAAGLRKVVVATGDPSKHASGAGLKQLRDAGIDVVVGVCEDQARLINAPFFKFAETGRCWVVVKWAQSIDAKLAYADPAQGPWLSSESSRSDAHSLRRRSGAVIVGVNTVIADNPDLTPRPSKGKNPLRVVLDRGLRTPLTSRLVSTAKRHPVLICTTTGAMDAAPKVVKAMQKKGVELMAGADGPDNGNLHPLLEHLAGLGVQQVLVEGGPKVIGSFLQEGLADEIRVYVAPVVLGGRGAADLGAALVGLPAHIQLSNVEIKRIGDDVRIGGLVRSTGSDLR